MFIIVNWWFEGSYAAIVTHEDGTQKEFVTREEAEEFCNTELNGKYHIIDLED
jgi:hypothetical protein